MTNEKRYLLCCDAIRAYATEIGHGDPGALLRIVEQDPTTWSKAGENFPVLAALAPIMQEAREGMDRATTSAETLAALKRIAKAATRDEFRGHWIDKEGRACLCSGFHVVRLQGVTLGSIPTVPGWENIDRVMTRPASGLYEIQLPTVAECKAWRAAHGKNDPMPIDKGRRWVSASYMLDMLQAMPSAVAYATDTARAPIWFESDQGDGLLMPMNPPKQSAA